MIPRERVLEEQLRLSSMNRPLTEDETAQLKALNARCDHVLYVDGEPWEQSLKNMQWRRENP